MTEAIVDLLSASMKMLVIIHWSRLRPPPQ